MKILTLLLYPVMNSCYAVTKNYGLAIILFTLVSKIVLLPVSFWLQHNSIKMVKIQPDINFLKARFYGDKEKIDEGQTELYKKERYNPAASIVPVIIQLVLLVGVIEVIKLGINNPDVNMEFMGINLSLIPSEVGISLVWSPIVAGISAWIMCEAQNRSNVLQVEQNKWNKYGVMIFSVLLSLYLGWFVSVGVALYWVASNLMSVAQLYFLNAVIPPSKYVDYERLEKSKKALAEIEILGKERGKLSKEDRKREKNDYKRFFNIKNKHLVFYSENSGFFKYYKGIIQWLLENTNVTIHYITSDPQDAIFEMSKEASKIKPYFITEKKLITLMMKIEADVVVMTMPDLENYHIKRSYIQKDIEYIFVPHSVDSINMTMRTGSVDHFDTIFCTGANEKEEIEAIEREYNLPKKKLVEWGYTLLDDMVANYEKKHVEVNDKIQILIAPSWQKDNIVDSCLEILLEGLKNTDYKITVRPHPQHVRHQGAYMETLKKQYKLNDNIEIQTDFSSNNTVFDADILITDWSGIAFEYAYTTLKPVLFINTPMKVMNPEYQKIDVIPINIWARNEIGKSYDVDQLEKIEDFVSDMIKHKQDYQSNIRRIRNENIYNLGISGQVGGEYIISRIREKIARK